MIFWRAPYGRGVRRLVALAAAVMVALCVLPAVAMAKAPVKLIYLPAAGRRTLVEYDDSYPYEWTDDTTGAVTKTTQRYTYEPDEGDRLIVTWDDGTAAAYAFQLARDSEGDEAFQWVNEANAADTLEGVAVIGVEPEQEAQDPWRPGDTDRTVRVTCYDSSGDAELCSTVFSVSIEANPVVGVSYMPANKHVYREGVDGASMAVFDPKGNPLDLWIYYPFQPQEGDMMRLYSDGGFKDYRCTIERDEAYFVNTQDPNDVQEAHFFEDLSDQSSDTPWGKGNHFYDLSFKGNRFSVPVTITPYAAPWKRLSGSNALDTMRSIAGKMPQETGGAVVLATSGGYKDALTAAGLAGITYAPVLLVNKTSLPEQTASLLKTFKPAEVFVVGGPAVISDTVLAQAAKLCGLNAADVMRVWGANSIATSVAVFETGAGMWSDTCVVARYDNFADALAIAPFSYATCAPIFLTKTTGVSGAVLNAIREGEFQNVIVVGGTAAVSGTAEDQLRGLGVNVTRLAGVNGVDTSGVIAQWCLDYAGMNVRNLAVATSTGYKDALTGAALCGANNSVLVLTRPGRDQYRAIDRVLSGNQALLVDCGYVYGGELAVPEAVRSHCLLRTKA